MSHSASSETDSSSLELSSSVELMSKSRHVESDTDYIDEDGLDPKQISLAWKPLRTTIEEQSLLCAAWALTLARSYEVEDVQFLLHRHSQQSRDSSTHDSPMSLALQVNHGSTIASLLLQVDAWNDRNSNGAEVTHGPAPGLPTESCGRTPSSTLLMSERPRGPEAAMFTAATDIVVGFDIENVTLNARPGALRRFETHGRVLLSRFKTAVEQLGSLTHSLTLDSISLQSQLEREAILDIYGPLAQPIEDCVHHLIARQAECSPQSIAICAWDTELTYAALDTLSTKLAHHLLDISVKIDDKVALCFNKSAWAVIAMLAVIKCGAAGFAISTANPPERTRTMMEQTQAQVILADRQHTSQLSGFAHTIVAIDHLFVESLPDLSRPLPVLSSRTIAYIIFTSGSTGKPKGIVTEHGSLCSSLHAHGQRFGIGPGSRVFNFAAYTFDISIADIFFTLALGATVCIPSESERVNDLAGAITKYRANWAFLTPTVTDTLDPASVPTLRTVFWSGEASTKPLVDKWAMHLEAIVSYGPAEASVHCAGSTPKRVGSDHQNVGRSLGCRMWVLDQNRPDCQALVGTIGEVAIEGRIIARGYLGEPTKTAQSFVWTKACTSEPIRVYKSGDMGRLNWDGTVTIIGRIDSQVKIRGQRVELGEIEQQFLKSLPGADTAVAWASSSSQTAHNLVMFFTMLNSDSILESEDDSTCPRVSQADPALLERLSCAQQRLRDYLPSYMMPSLFIPLSEIPRTPHGKTDRRALTEILSSLSERESRLFSLAQDDGIVKRQPGTALEAKLRHLVADQLRIVEPSVGVDDDFFRLGGNSLTAIKMCAAARASDLPLTVAMVMEHPTIEQMATALSNIESRTESPEDATQASKPFALLKDSVTTQEIIKSAAKQCQTPDSAIQDVYPCTPMQQSLYLQSMKSPGSYIVKHAWDLPETVDIARFRRAWQVVFTKNDILRTRLIEGSADSLWQAVIHDEMQWHDVPFTATGNSATMMAVGSRLFRFNLLPNKEAKCRHQFVLEAHHAVIDGWTMTLLLDQFEAAFTDSQMPPTLQFNHFMRHLTNEDAKNHDEFWRTQLDGFASTPSQTTPYNRGARGVVRSRASLNSVALAFTTSDYLKAAWAIVMSSHERRKDVALGVVDSCRDSPLTGVENVVGPLIATLPVRVRVESDKPVQMLMQAIRTQRIAMMPHRQIGLGGIAELSDDAKAACDLQNLIVVQPAVSASGRATVLPREHMTVDVQLEDTALVLECHLDDSHVELNLDHGLSVLSKPEAEQMLDRFASVFEQLQAASPTICVGDVCSLSRSDMAKIENWNTIMPEQWDSCVQDLFAEQVSKSPHAPAVEAWDGAMDFTQLDETSSRLATYLASLGVTAGDCVPVCLEKSLWFVAGVLAVLKTGAAFVPLDSLQPPQRLKEIIEIVSAKHCLVAQHTRKLLSADDCALVTVPEVLTTEATLYGDFAHNDPTSLAYMVFTSGSTGKPKGVMVNHSAYVSGALARAPLIHRNKESRVFAFSSHSFDTTIEDVLTTLLFGGCICIPSENERKNDLSGAINRYRANTFDTTPSIITLVDPRSVPGIKTLILGGEAVTAENVALWSAQTTLINTYGPCECAIVSTLSHLSSPDAVSSNIGRGVGCLSWVVDENDHDRLMPVGAVGELLIEGPIVGGGYLGNEQQTRAAFVETTRWRRWFNYSQSWRMYKTGDLVRYAADGSITFLGRKDSQVKIRGQRVEPGEIEDKLREAIQDQETKLVVECVRLTHRAPVVVAFLSNTNKEHSARLLKANSLPTDLRAAAATLSARIPAYMMPTYYVRLNDFPRTSTEKVDRKNLRGLFESLLQDASEDEEQSEAPTKQQPTHFAGIALQALWAGVLKIPASRIGLQDNFFALGGDSIGAMQLVSTCKQSGMPLTVAQVFQAPDLEAMVAQVISQMGTSSQAEASPKSAQLARFSLVHPDLAEDVLERLSTSYEIARHDVQDIYPCSPLQEAFFRGSLQSPGAFVATHTFKIGQSVDLDRLRAAWAAVAEANDILRTRIIETESGSMLQIVLNEKAQWQQVITLDDCLSEAEWMRVEFGSRLSLFSLVEEPSPRLVWTAHHSVFDAWTLDLLKEALEAAYNGLSYDVEPYNIYIQHVDSMDKSAATNFWKDQLAAPPDVNSIGSKASTESNRQEETLTSTLQVVIPSKNKLLPSTYVNAAWALAIAQYLETEDVIFGSVSAGRNLAVDGIVNTVGPTMTTFPTRVTIDQDESVRSLLERVQSQSAATMQYEQLGIQHIRELNDDCRRACQFETLVDVHPAEIDTTGDMAIALESSRAPGSAFHTHPFVVTCRPGTSDIWIEFVFDTAVIKSVFACRLMDQFQHMLRQMTDCIKANSSTKVSDLELISPADKQQLMAWNAAEFTEVHECIHDRVHAQALQRPDAMAIQGWDASFTYKELDDLSTRLASHLISLGVGERPVVPLCFTKSAWTVVAELAVLKVGGAYVALDASHPHDRLKVMVEQTRAQTMILASEFMPVFESHVQRVIVLDASFRDELLRRTVSSQLPVVPSDSPAFICFTSGSTGLPKGVVLQHDGFCTLDAYVSETMQLSPSSRVLQFAAYAFDVSNAETFLTLLNGATLFIASDYDRMNNLVGVLKRWEINWLFLTPTFAATVSAEDIKGVKTFTMGGEAPRQDLIDEFAHRVRLINAYGPAEGTIWPTITRFYPDSDPRSVGVSGSGCHVWLVSPKNHNQLVPVGVTGEILLEGPMVGPGYLFNEAKTKAAFIDPPSWAHPRADGKIRKFYKVGDLAVQQEDGSLSFVGRKDNQVKLRGQRLELGEVEHRMLAESNEFAAAAADIVTLKQGGKNVQALIAFLRRADGTGFAFSEGKPDLTPKLMSSLTSLRTALMRHLPSYMVPSFYVPLRKFPTTASGKLDRKVLRQEFENLAKADQLVFAFQSSAKRRPATPRERQVCSIWAQVLHLGDDEIGMDDSPLHLGADSMAAIKASGLARKHGLGMPVTVILRATSMTHLCEAVTSLMPEEQSASASATYTPFSLLRDRDLGDLKSAIARQCRVDESRLVDAYPVTKLQEGMIMLSKKEPGSYVSQFQMKLDESIDIERFKKAWLDVLRKCDILRTRAAFTETHGVVQAVLDDASYWKEADHLENYLRQDRSQGMDYGDALMRYCLVSEANSTVRHFVWTVHHSVYDGWTVQRIPELLRAAYKGEALAIQPPFSAFVKEVLAMDEKAASEFWSAQLDGFTVPDFALARSQPGTKPTAGRLTRSMTKSGNAQLAFTESVLVQAAWGVLLGQYYNSQDVTYGLTVSGRDPSIPSILEIAGPTISTVPKRVRLADAQTIEDLLRAVQDQNMASMPYDQYGLQMIRKCSEDAQAACNFETLLLIDAPVTKKSIDDAEWTFTEGDHTANNETFHAYPFVLSAILDEDSMLLEAEFDASVISEARAGKLLEQLEQIIQELKTASPTTTIAELDLLTNEDHESLSRWNRGAFDVVKKLTTSVDDESDLLVQSHLWKHAKAQPLAEAIFSSELVLSYEALDKVTNSLAAHLQSLGIGPESFVPVCMEKSAQAIVATVSIIKAGAAFVPLDSKFPAMRIEEILNQTAAKHVIASPATKIVFDNHNVHTVELSPDSIIKLMDAAANPSLLCRPENALYIIYTSGSTGKPKGVVTEHQAFCAGVLARSEAQRRTSKSRILQFASYTFDMSIEDILATLMNGGTVCVPTEYERINTLGAFMTQARVNAAHLTPSTLSTISPDEVPTLETLLLLGEAMTQDNVNVWADRVTLINTYGPSEASVVSTVTPQVRRDADPANIGIGYGCGAYIVDPRCHDKLVVIGGVGELLLEGPILARHYLKQPDKTDSVFISNPVWANGGADAPRRFYKTGDLCRYSLAGDGSIVFVGRKDTQVKLRGSRIELGEIETRLQELLPEEQLSVDVVNIGGKEKKELAAFVVVKDEEQDDGKPITDVSDAMLQQLRGTTEGLEERLKEVLPAVMIPTQWLPIRRMPLSSSGKRDRKALQAMARNIRPKPDAATSSKRRAPRGDDEILMSELWARTLSIDTEEIDIDDHFMSVGGDSILAMRLAALARSKGINLTVADIFKYPVLRDMARHCAKRSDDRAVSPIVATHKGYTRDASFDEFISRKTYIPLADVADVVPATDFQRWCITTDRMRSRGWSNYWEMDFTTAIDKSRFLGALDQLAAQHSILRTAFVFRKQQLLQVVRTKPQIDHEHFSVVGDPYAQADSWVNDEMRSEGVLQTGGLRLATFSSAADTVKKAIITLSHARFDALSLSLMSDDLAAAYDGKSLPIRPDFGRFIDYISQDEQQRNAENFWRALLHRSEMTRVSKRPEGHCYKYPVAKTHVKSIRRPQTSQPFTFATILKAAWALTLARHSQISDVVFGHLVSGRAASLENVDEVVGPCINLIPVRVPIGEGSTQQSLLTAVRDQHMAAMPHENLGFDRIIEHCTSWPRATRFTSIVQHQNVHEVDKTLFDNGTIDAAVKLRCPPHDSTDVWVISLPKEDNVVDVTLSCNEDLINDAVADDLLQTLVDNINDLQTLEKAHKTPRVTSAEDKSATSTPNPQEKHLTTAIRDVWCRVLGTSSTLVLPTTPYFNIRGDVSTPLLLLKEYHLRFTKHVELEDLIDRPTLQEHVALLLDKTTDAL